LHAPISLPSTFWYYPNREMLSFFVLCRHIRRVDDQAGNAFRSQLIMDPETTVARFINRIIGRPRKVVLQVVDQRVHLGRLGKSLMFALLRMNAHTPTLLMYIQTDVERLTRKINFAKVIHGKSPFGRFFPPKQHYNRISKVWRKPESRILF
jgi:hypothetical protein